MTTKWMLRVVTAEESCRVYGPYGQKRAEQLSLKLNEYFRTRYGEWVPSGEFAVPRAFATPMWDPGITELRSQYQ